AADMTNDRSTGSVTPRSLAVADAQLQAPDPALPDEQPLSSLGRFQLRKELGRGGFGIVYLADDPLLGRSVAVKVPRPEVLTDPDLRQRFLREAQVAATLNHPTLVPVYEAGAAGPLCYIASAYCPGVDLAAWLKSHPGPMETQTAVRLIA